MNIRSLLTRSSGKIIGKKEVARGIKENKFSHVIIADNADEHIKAEIKKLCQDQDVEIIGFRDMSELGVLCDIEVACSVVGINKEKNK